MPVMVSMLNQSMRAFTASLAPPAPRFPPSPPPPLDAPRFPAAVSVSVLVAVYIDPGIEAHDV